jgi:hypothetical protein
MGLPFLRDMVGEKLLNGQRGELEGRIYKLRFSNKFKEERGKRIGLICDRLLV